VIIKLMGIDMNSTQTYEKIVKVKNTGKHLAKKISLIMSYVLLFSVWLAAALRNIGNKSFVLILLAGALVTFSVIILTWKYTQLEYEYSFWYGHLSIAKIYGKKKRKTIIDTDVKDLLIIAPATDEYIAKAEHFDLRSRVIAVSDENADNIWLTVTGGEDEHRILIFFEADERSLTMLKNTNPISFVRSK
jgi:hypothetical protein